MKTASGFVCLAIALSFGAGALADTFGTGVNVFDIEFVSIGNPGNPADTLGTPNPVGSVDYDFRIGKYEISRGIIEKANLEAGLGIILRDMTSYNGNGPEQPATGLDWFDAASFINWLNSSSGYPLAYKFNGSDFELWQPEDEGFDAANPFRNSQTHYFLPNLDEWYKAAYYDPQVGSYYSYPIDSSADPTPVANGTTPGTAVFSQGFSGVGPAEVTQAGGLSSYGTMAQGGNVSEWQESEYDLVNDDATAFRAVRGGAWYLAVGSLHAQIWSIGTPSFSSFDRGFRVASVAQTTSSVDFDGDGDTDGYDFLLWQRGESPNPLSEVDLVAWEASYGSGSLTAHAMLAVPETSSMVHCLLILITVLMQIRRIP